MRCVCHGERSRTICLLTSQIPPLASRGRDDRKTPSGWQGNTLGMTNAPMLLTAIAWQRKWMEKAANAFLLAWAVFHSFSCVKQCWFSRSLHSLRSVGMTGKHPRDDRKAPSGCKENTLRMTKGPVGNNLKNPHRKFWKRRKFIYICIVINRPVKHNC